MDPRRLSTAQFRARLRALRVRQQAGFFGPGSLTWRINREVVLHAAGPRALLMQLAHPAVARGVADHSAFREDPYGRAIRTFTTVYKILFGNRDEAVKAAARVHAVHQKVHGTLRDDAGRHRRGDPYQALDPALLRWVYATLVDSAVFAYDLLVRRLRPNELETVWQECARGAILFGIERDRLPETWRDFTVWLEATICSDEIAVSPTAYELGQLLLRAPPSRLIRPMTPAVRLITAGMLHPKLRGGFGLAFDRRSRPAWKVMARASRALVHRVPPPLREVPWARTADRRCAG